MRFNWVRSIFKQIPILYRIAFRFYLSSRFGGDGRLPRKEDDFYFDGYAKSGNSSLSSFLRSVSTRDLVFSSHLHSVAPLKIALQFKLPSVVIYRDPYNSIAS